MKVNYNVIFSIWGEDSIWVYFILDFGITSIKSSNIMSSAGNSEGISETCEIGYLLRFRIINKLAVVKMNPKK